MSSGSPRRFWYLRLLILFVGVGLLGLTGRHAWAWYHFWAARSELARYHPRSAREHLTHCLTLWPNSPPTLLLASRAARQAGDLEEADRHLRACQQGNGGNPDEIALEWAMLQATGGNLREVEEYLQRRADREAAVAPLVWEAVAEGYIRLYRILDAAACLELWLRVDPNNLRAHELRGIALQTGKQTRKAVEDFRRVLELDPVRDEARERLASCLLDMGSYDEALSHLEYIERQKPDEPDVQVRLARCHNMLGQPERARQVLDAVLEVHPTHAAALRARGHFALGDRRPDQAETWLRRAADVHPNDYQTNWLLYQALQQQNKTEAAQAQLRRAEEVKERAERLGELMGRKLFEQPLDPALHCETGVLLLRSGNDGPAEGWLLSALNLDPRHAPAHKALVELYERRGDTTRAEEHRSAGK